MAIRPPRLPEDDEEPDELDDETVFESVNTVEDFLAEVLNQWPVVKEKP